MPRNHIVLPDMLWNCFLFYNTGNQIDQKLIENCFVFLDTKKPSSGGGMMGMPMTPGGGGGKFNTVAARPSSGTPDRNIPNSWNRSHDDSEYFTMY